MLEKEINEEREKYHYRVKTLKLTKGIYNRTFWDEVFGGKN